MDAASSVVPPPVAPPMERPRRNKKLVGDIDLCCGGTDHATSTHNEGSAFVPQVSQQVSLGTNEASVPGGAGTDNNLRSEICSLLDRREAHGKRSSADLQIARVI